MINVLCLTRNSYVIAIAIVLRTEYLMVHVLCVAGWCI
jgi:hypothetical protein